MSKVTVSIEALHAAANNAKDIKKYYFDVGVQLLGGMLGEEGKAYAYEFLTPAAEMGHVDAMYELGMCYRWGDGGVYAEAGTAMHWFRNASRAGHKGATNLVDRFDSPEGLNILLMSAMHGINGEGSNWFKVKNAVDFYYHEAHKGNAECQYELARQKSDPGHYGPFRYDINEAIFWYTKAAESGMVDAMFNLAYIYFNGSYDLDPDKEMARLWFTKASEAGDEEATEYLAREELWQ